ncbi:hypothetical protein FACS1894187_07010 [Synergistales bacterium]|nr:hypothetical protein FACS1894187_07010 [Synergistales bacterium]
MSQVLPPDNGRKKAYDKATLIPLKYQHNDGNVSEPSKFGTQIMPPDAGRAEVWRKLTADNVKFLFSDGSVYDGDGLYELLANGVGSTPTLQAVSDAGNTTTNPILISDGEGEGSTNVQLSTEQLSVSKYGESEGMVAPGLLQLYGKELASSFGVDLNEGTVTGSDDIKTAFRSWLGLDD